jgi:uncharacterized protein
MRIILLAAAVFLLAGGSAHALDCAKPGAPAEYVVCSDKGLQTLLAQRLAAYKAARARSSAAERKALADDNRHWLKSYQAACGVAAAGGQPTLDPAVVRCFAHAFQARIAWLSDYPPKGAAPPPPQSAAKPPPAAAASPPASVHFAFTFACRTPQKLKLVLRALARNDMSYPLSQSDCLPLVKGRAAQLLAVAGTVARIRLCSPDAGCIDLYADVGRIIRASGAAPDPQSAGK